MKYYEKYSSCFSNKQCTTGFCKNGQCRDPTKQNDACEPSLNNCPRTLQCSEYSHTCIPLKYQKWIPCRSQSDCKFGNYCIDGECIASIPIGRPCDSIAPDLCVMEAKCTSIDSQEATKCHELCSEAIPCPTGYNCIKNLWNEDAICVPQSNPKTDWKMEDLVDEEVIVAFLITLALLVILLGAIYGWIRLTRSGKDPRLLSKKKLKKKKRLRLNYDGNGLATITLIPSNCQSPNPITAASQLFPSSRNDDAPPPYSEVVIIQ